MTMPYEAPDEYRFLRISPTLAIPRAELEFHTSRSSGPGGQHVNKTETRVELRFDVANSPSLTDEQRELLLVALKPWLDSTGVLHLIADNYRSQYRNREEALARFITILMNALRPKKSRKSTRIPRSVKEKRLEHKHERSGVKRQRQARGDKDW